MSEPPALAQANARSKRALRSLARVALIGGLVLGALISFLVIGTDVGPVPLLTGLGLATVPVPIYLGLALRIDRFDPEPRRTLAWAFFWGASAATCIALVLNTLGQLLVGSNFGSDVGEIYGNSISAPIVEESSKAVVLFAIYRWRRGRLDGVLDGLVYAAMVGLGFAMTENVLYYGHAAVEGGVPLAATFFMRGVLSPFTHPVFTAMTGIGLGIASRSTERWKQLGAPVAGLATAVLLHSLWNTSATVGGGSAFVGVYFLLMVPIFVALIVVSATSLSREGRLVGSELHHEVQTGVLSAADVRMLASLSERRRMLRAAKHDGPDAKRTCRAFQHTATELAFHRHRWRQGLPTGSATPADDDRSLVATLSGIRDRLSPATRAAIDRPVVGPVFLRPGTATASALPAPAAVPPPSWHPDPWRQARWRWWDGAAWTHHVAN